MNIITDKKGEDRIYSIEPLKLVGREGNNYTFEAELAPRQAGEYRSAVRMYPKSNMLPHRQDFCYVRWIELPQII